MKDSSGREIALNSKVRNACHSQQFGLRPGQDLPQPLWIQILVFPMNPGAVLERKGVAHVKHDIIAEACDLIAGSIPFQIDFHPADLGQALRQCSEKIRIDCQLALLLNVLLHTAPNGITAQGVRSQIELYGSMKSLQQSIVAHISYKYRATRSYRLRRASYHCCQVLKVGEVLNH